MTKKIYVLSTCKTCQRILEQINCDGLEIQDIKKDNISEEQLEEMYQLAGNYESLFTKRSMKYRKWGLNEQTLSEQDFKDYILKEYTFLKRPVAVIGNEIFIGNSKKNIEALKNALNR